MYLKEIYLLNIDCFSFNLLDPYYTLVFIGDKLDLAKKFFNQDDLKAPYTKEEFLEIRDSNIEYFKGNIDLFEEFYATIKPNIDDAIKGLERVKTL